MILIVWYHTDHPTFLNYAFFNTTLFFVSGFLFKKSSWSSFFKKKGRHFFIPFLFFYLVYYAFLISINLLKDHSVNPDILSSIFDVFRCYKDNDAYICNYPLWFIWALFWVQAQTNLLLRVFDRPIFLFLCSIVISTIGYCFIQHLYTPFIIGRSTTFLVYFIFGYISRKYLIHDKINYHIICLSLIIWLILYYFNCSFFFQTKCIIVSIINDITFSVILLELCKGINQTHIHTIISFYGVNSIIVFGLHDMYLSILRMITTNLFGEMNLSLGCMNWVLALLLMIPTIFYLNNHFPVLVGREKSMK